jgi:peptidoglycan/xylan/chitin deacetylase (PgdA/CDA1 family)
VLKILLKRLLSAHSNHRYIFWRLNNTKRRIALTFDDGPHPEYTSQILDTLDRFNAKATFFVLGQNMERSPGIIKALLERGHEIGLHSYKHDSFAHKNLSEIHGDFMLCSSFRSRPSQSNMLFRPPYGDLSLPLMLYAWTHKLSIVLWTFDSMDSFVKSPEDIISRISASSIVPGDILLFHDDYEITNLALPKIIENLQSKGFELCTVSSCIGS